MLKGIWEWLLDPNPVIVILALIAFYALFLLGTYIKTTITRGRQQKREKDQSGELVEATISTVVTVQKYDGSSCVVNSEAYRDYSIIGKTLTVEWEDDGVVVVTNSNDNRASSYDSSNTLFTCMWAGTMHFTIILRKPRRSTFNPNWVPTKKAEFNASGHKVLVEYEHQADFIDLENFVILDACYNGQVRITIDGKPQMFDIKSTEVVMGWADVTQLQKS